jgi:hypothetical protein
MKKLGVYITVLLLLSGIANANYYNDWYFKNEAGTQVTQVKMIGWRCEPKNSPTCASVKRTIPFTIQTTPLTSGTTNHIKSEFTAATSVPEYFIVYAYHPDYQLIAYSGWEFSTYSGIPLKASTRNENFLKKDNCKADFTLNIQSCAEAGMPLSILTDTELSASTASAFIINTFYWPPELDAWRDISTKVTATVKKQGTTTNVYSSEDTKKIYAGTTKDFSFLWQTSKNTLPGNYIITMKSYVTDQKCDQTNDVVTTVTQTVNIAESLDGCVAQVQNFRLEPTSPAPGTQVLIKGERLHTYQDWSWDETTTACTAGNAQLISGAYLDTAYTLKIKQGSTVIKTQTGTLPKNTQTYNTYKAFQIPWTPTAAQCGSYEQN